MATLYICAASALYNGPSFMFSTKNILLEFIQPHAIMFLQ
jgi:hypothetical protein